MPAAATAHDQPGSGACPEQLDAAPDPARKGGAALTVPRQPPSQDDDGIGFLRHVPSGRPQRKWRYPTRAGERSTGGGHMSLYRELMNGLLRSEERRIGKECVSRVDLGGRGIIKKQKTDRNIIKWL